MAQVSVSWKESIDKMIDKKLIPIKKKVRKRAWRHGRVKRKCNRMDKWR